MSGAIFCPSTDHDGAQVPVVHQIVAERTDMTPANYAYRIESDRCEWCSEGRVAAMLRDGYKVTITPVRAKATA